MSIETTDTFFALAGQLLRQAQRVLSYGRGTEAIELLKSIPAYTQGIIEHIEAEPGAFAPPDRQLCRVAPNERGGFSLSVPDAGGHWRPIGNGPEEAMLELARINGFAVERLAAHLATVGGRNITAYIPLDRAAPSTPTPSLA